MEQVSTGFKEETSAFLSGMGLTVSSFYEVLGEAHDWMRERAEENR